MKILYIEDEINQHIDNISKMFTKYLDDSIKKQLDDLLVTYDANELIPKQIIQEIVEKSGIIHILESDDTEVYQPTLETIQAVVCMLKDIILWFDKIMSED